MTNIIQRHHLARLMDYFVEHEYSVRYPPGDVRTMRVGNIAGEKQLYDLLLAGKLMLDCSQNVEVFFKVVGLKDPSGPKYDYKVDGYTGSMLAHLPGYSDPGNADVGALAIFGPGTGDHVAQVRHPGKNPLLYSHGSDHSAYFTSLSVERTYHRPPVRFLNIAHL